MIRTESSACLIELLLTPSLFNVLQVWTVSSGFCFITFSEHTNAVTAVHFMANNHSLLSASLDGTIRAWDLFRYRNFRTFTTPSPRQFVSLTADQSGEVICAGTLDSFEVCKPRSFPLQNFSSSFLFPWQPKHLHADICLVNENWSIVGCTQWPWRTSAWSNVFTNQCKR